LNCARATSATRFRPTVSSQEGANRNLSNEFEVLPCIKWTKKVAIQNLTTFSKIFWTSQIDWRISAENK